MNIIGTILTTLGILILFIKLFNILIVYRGKTEGKIIDCQTKSRMNSNMDIIYVYKYTINYTVDAKEYIYQQKFYSEIYLNNRKIIIKYNKKKPQKSKLEQENNMLVVGIILIFFGIIFCSIGNIWKR